MVKEMFGAFTLFINRGIVNCSDLFINESVSFVQSATGKSSYLISSSQVVNEQDNQRDEDDKAKFKLCLKKIIKKNVKDKEPKPIEFNFRVSETLLLSYENS
jgi:hypothetical protein